MIPLFHRCWLVAIVLMTCCSGIAQAERPSERYRIAAFHYSRGEWQEAVRAFDRFLQEHPDHTHTSVVHFYRGESLIQLSRHEQAIAAYTKFLSLAPEHAHAQHAEFRLAECYFLIGRHEAAAKALERFQADYPESPLIAHGYPYLAQIAEKNREWDEALRCYQEAIQGEATPLVVAEARLGLARLHARQEAWEKAVRTYDTLLSQEPFPPQIARDTVLLEAGIAEFRSGNYRRAIKRFERITFSPELKEQTQFWIAKTHFQVRDWPRALEQLRPLQQAEALSAFQDEISYLIARCEYSEGEVEKAGQRLEVLLQRWPESKWAGSALYQLVVIHLDQKDWSAAQAAWQRLRTVAPDSLLATQAQLALATELERVGQHQEALVVLESSNPSAQVSAKEVSRHAYLKGAVLFALNRLDEAEQTLQEVIKSDSEDARAERGLAAMLQGMIHSQRQEWHAAAVCYADAVVHLESAEQKVATQLRLATALAHCRQWEKARKAASLVDTNRLERRTYLQVIARLAQAAYRGGEAGWAEELYQQLAKEDNPPEFVEQGLAGLAWCQVSDSTSTAGADALDQLLQSYPDSPLAIGALFRRAQQLEQDEPQHALRYYRQLIEHHPNEPMAAHAQLRVALLLDEAGEDAEAEQALVRLLDEAPQNLPPEDLWYRLAWVRLDQKKQAAAMAAFAEIHQRYQDSPLWEDATYRLAEHALQENDLEQTQHYLQQLLTRQSSSKITLFGRYMLGQVEVQSGNWNAALSHMQAVAETANFEPLHSMALFWSGEALFRTQKFEAAQAAFEQMVTNCMGRELESLPVAEMRLAQILAHQGEWVAALQRAEHIQEKYPAFRQNFELDYLLGRCLARQGNFERARAAYKNVLSSPEAVETETAAMAQWMIGETYFHQKEFDAAIRAYAKVVANQPNFPQWQAAALLQIGKCHEIQESWEKATQYYTEVRSQFSQTPFAPEAETRLSVVRQRTEQARLESKRNRK